MKKNKNLLLLGLILIGIAFATSYPSLSPASAIMPQIPWSNETLISNFNNLTAADPVVATDSQGNAHIIWMQKTSNLIGEIFYTKLDKFGNTIIHNRQLTNFSGVYGFPLSMAIDRFDDIHMAWIWDVTGTSLHGIRYLRMDSNGNIILNDSILQNAPGTEIATDSQGNIIVVGNGDNEIYYAKYDNQGNVLTPRTLVTNTSQFEPLNLKVSVDENDLTYITWMEEFYPSGSSSRIAHIKYSSVDSNGNVIVNGYHLDNGMNQSTNPAIAIDGQNNVLFSWDSTFNNTSGIYLSKINSNGTFLINKKFITGSGGNAVLAVNPIGRISLITQGKMFSQLDQAGNFIIFPVNLGSSQSYSLKGSSDRQGNIHLVWHEGPSFNNVRVKYQRSLNPAAITMQGTPIVGRRVNFILEDIYNLKSNYVLGLSTNISQGITLPDGRILPLDNTPMLQTSLNNPQSIGLSNSIGRLRINQSKVTWAIPNNSSLSNTTLYTSFVTLDSNGGIVSISDPLTFTII